MISTNEFRTGLTVEVDGDPCQVIEFMHVKPGKGSPFVRAKLKNLRTGAIAERTFNAGEKLPRAILERKEMQYLYNDGANYYLMDNETYDQVGLSAGQLGDGVKYLKENMIINVVYHRGQVLGVYLPNTVELTVIETTPGIRGDTASGGSKPAVLETGVVLQVPLFVEEGDVIQVDTRSGAYIKRA
ncbi:elongation factor P [Candidatus Desulforudis audaxviator]|uniref:elongation factor P n=1 Tax=Candidatus Desulforudis audaxviator TaxID=471827 RepID=UPI00107C8E88|nr:elongation factor P [Candidatus Desulforudis audaxviator]AZK59500.1 Translation elongation factor P [Candidatus Desulforudis audaxviator]